MSTFQFLFDLPSYQAAKYPQRAAGGHWHQGAVREWSSDKLGALVRSVALRLLKEGVAKGDRVILIAEKFNLEWLATDMAVMSIGAISTPVHYPMRPDDLNYIFIRMEARLVIRSKDIPLISLPMSSGSFTFDELIEDANPVSDEGIRHLEQIRSSIDVADIATIVHTSGSSGEPRAVCLSHRNIVSNVMSTLSLVPFTAGTRVMSFLPLSHIFERIVCYVYLACGANVYFIDSYRYVVFALKDIRPAYFSCVPLILERFAAALEDRIEDMGWFTRWAYRSWEKTDRGLLSHIGSVIAHQWIIKRWKKKMGGKLKGIISGAAYLDPKVERLYERSGIQIRQGYGLTEASPCVAINRFEPGGHRRGTVGLPLPGVEVKIADDGEILAKGPNVMVGYYKDEDATAKAIVDGWLRTGDIGRWDKDGFLIIYDRKSNIYKHASGKFISPAQIESRLLHHPLIHQAMIVGYHKPFTIAIILPHFDSLKKVCEEKHIHWTAPEYMVHNTIVLQLFRDLLDHLDLQSHERIEKFVLVADEWSAENGLLTATYKPRRGELMKKYEKEINEIFE